MAFCGYNEEIGKGIEFLIAGMTRAIERKTDTTGKTVKNALMEEIRELDAIVLKSDCIGIPGVFCSLNSFAQRVFEVALKGMENEDAPFRDVMRKIGVSLSEKIIEIDARRERLVQSGKAKPGKEVGVLLADSMRKDIQTQGDLVR